MEANVQRVLGGGLQVVEREVIRLKGRQLCAVQAQDVSLSRECWSRAVASGSVRRRFRRLREAKGDGVLGPALDQLRNIRVANVEV